MTFKNKFDRVKYSREYYLKNSEKIKKGSAQFQKDNPEMHAKNCRTYYEKNQERLKKASNDYYWAHHEERLAYDKKKRDERKQKKMEAEL